MSREHHLTQLRELLQRHRWAALATLDADGQPEASMVAYALNPALTELYLHLSELAAHTRNLLDRPSVSLAISDTDEGRDPQQLRRASLFGRVERIEREESSWSTARDRYLSRLPDAAMLFNFGDFQLFRLRIDKVRFVGGFGSAHTLSGTALALQPQ
ncbi:MAG: HugZ family protein [Pseudomonadota bacterium]